MSNSAAVTETPFARAAILAVILLHGAVAIVGGLILFAAVSGGVGALTHPRGVQVREAVLEFAGIFVGLALIVVQLTLIGGLQRRSVVSWWVDVTIGGISFMALLANFVTNGVPRGGTFASAIAIFGLPAAAAVVLLLPNVRKNFQRARS